jgi:hypothetical protein
MCFYCVIKLRYVIRIGNNVSRINSDFAVTGRELGPFEAHSDAHATTDTERGQAAFGLAPMHFE